MWTLFVLLYLGALHGTVSFSPPSPTNVIFTSVNLKNLLQWLPGDDTPDDTLFTVQYAIYGDSVEGSKGRRVNWRVVQQCTEIESCWCDLSNETWDLEQGYHARVRAVSRKASSKWAPTRRRFDPNLDTTFGPPLVSVEIEDQSAIITLKGPMRYQPNNHTPVISMATHYPQMIYDLSILNTRRDQTSNIPVVSSPYKYSLMEYDTEYCFSAKSRFLSMPVQCKSSVWHCITTPPDPMTGQLQKVVVGIAVPSVCMCMLVVVGYLLYHYLTGKGQKSPYILSQPSFYSSPLTFTPEDHTEKNPHVILITFINDQPSDNKWLISDPECYQRQRAIASPPPRYSPQRSGTPSEPEEPWDDLSVDYGFVCQAPQLDVIGEQEGRERGNGGGEDWNNLKGEQQKCLARGCYEKKEGRVGEGLTAGVYAAQAKSYLSQNSTHACSQTHMAEMSTLVQAQAYSHSGLLAQTNAPLQSFQGATKGEEVSKSERAPLLSAYASQNTKDMFTSHAGQSDFLPDDYGVLSLATAEEIEDDDDDEGNGEVEEETSCIDWDPKTRKLVLPEIGMEFNKEGGMDGLTRGGKERENERRGEEIEEGVNVMKGVLRLENVLVKQASEEEAQREMERGGEAGLEVDDILSKWNLVITMD